MKINALVLFIVFELTSAFASQSMRYAVYSGIAKLLRSQFGERAQKLAFKTQEHIDKHSGKDLSLGDLSGMDVAMVKVIEPYEKYAVISEYISNRLSHLKGLIKGFFAAKTVSQKDFNELIGLTIILNETDASAAEVLLSTRQCLLSNDDHYFKKTSNEPCRELSQETFSKIISRIEEIQDTAQKMGSSVQVPSAWDNHLRLVVLKLDLFSSDILNNPEKWNKIKGYIRDKSIL